MVELRDISTGRFCVHELWERTAKFRQPRGGGEERKAGSARFCKCGLYSLLILCRCFNLPPSQTAAVPGCPSGRCGQSLLASPEAPPSLSTHETNRIILKCKPPHTSVFVLCAVTSVTGQRRELSTKHHKTRPDFLSLVSHHYSLSFLNYQTTKFILISCLIIVSESGGNLKSSQWGLNFNPLGILQANQNCEYDFLM